MFAKIFENVASNPANYRANFPLPQGLSRLAFALTPGYHVADTKYGSTFGIISFRMPELIRQEHIDDDQRTS
jgi:hypothetical protein